MRGSNSKNEKKKNQKPHSRDSKEVKGDWKVEAPKRHILGHYWMYITDFKFIAQFWDELCEEQSQKMKKNEQKPLFSAYEGVKRGWKAKTPKKHIYDCY